MKSKYHNSFLMIFAFLGLVLWLCVRSVVTRNPLSCWSASFRSSAWWEKLPRISRLTCASKVQPLELCRLAAFVAHIIFQQVLLLLSKTLILTTPGSQWGLPGWTVWGHQPLRNPCQACHHHAQRHPAGTSYPWGTCLKNVFIPYMQSLIPTSFLPLHTFS